MLVRTGFALPFIACLVGAFAGPASAQLFGGDDEARRQVAAERKRVDDLASRIGAQGETLRSIDERLAKLDQASRGQQGLLDLLREIEALKGEVAKLRGQVEVLSNGVETTQKRQRDLYVDLDTRLRRLESPSVPSASAPASAAPAQPASQPPPPVAGKPVASAPSAAAPSEGSSEARAYEAAQDLRRIGNYQGAIVAFQSFVKQHPRSTLASSAQYWIGDSFFNLRDFRQAISSQRTLIALYPDSQKVPDALLNIASSQAELGETAVARRTMEEIVAKYPVSEAAEKAKRRLAGTR